MLLVPSLWTSLVFADRIEKIVIDGSVRYSRATLLTYAAIDEGDEIFDQDIPQIIHNLYLTDFFDDLSVSYDDEEHTLNISVREKPILGKIDFIGCSHFSQTELTKALTEYKIEVGRAFNERSLENMIRELQAMYHLDGYYETSLPYSIDVHEDGALAVTINIAEGSTAKVSAINIHGNQSFPSYMLRSALSLQSSNAMTFITSADKYSEYKIEQDCQTLENFYHDHGYPMMKVVDKRISLTESRRGIIIDIFIVEGDYQKVIEIELDAPIEIAIDRYDRLEVPFIWNQSAIDLYESKIRDSLNVSGYVYGEIIQERIELNTGECRLIYHVSPGMQYRIRDYHIHGNTLTQERIIRNFITRPEGTLYASSDLHDLNDHLMRSSLFSNVQLNPQPVGAQEVDLHVTVEEDKTKKVFATGAISTRPHEGSSEVFSNMGFMWNMGYEDRNILGTGTKTIIKIESDTHENVFQFSLANPYVTTKNIECYVNFERILRRYQNDYMFFKQDRNIYSTTVGASWRMRNDIRFGLSTNYFIEKDKNETEVLTNPGETPWAHYVFASTKLFKNMFNRYVLPDRGYRWELFSQASLPIGDYTYTDCGLVMQHYQPLGRSGFIFYQHFSGRVMTPYGQTAKSVIPSTRLLSCGGSDDIRGYHYSAVGPEIRVLQSDETYSYKTVGGNIKASVKSECIIPNSLFNMDFDQVRLSLFLDVAQLWRTVPVPDAYNENGNTYLPSEGLRVAGGLCLRFVSPILPPMTMSVNYPLIRKDRDKIKYEYFSFGSQMEF